MTASHRAPRRGASTRQRPGSPRAQVEPFTGDSPLKRSGNSRRGASTRCTSGQAQAAARSRMPPPRPRRPRASDPTSWMTRTSRRRRSPQLPSVHVARAGRASRDECSPTIPPRSHRASGSSVRAGSASISACPRRRGPDESPKRLGDDNHFLVCRDCLQNGCGVIARPSLGVIQRSTAARARRDRAIAAQRRRLVDLRLRAGPRDQDENRHCDDACSIFLKLAEREGFEPSNEVSPVTRFPVAPVQPLRHLSWRFEPRRPGGASEG